MTDLSADIRSLADAIYGGPHLAPAVAERLMARWRLPLGPALNVIAIDASQPIGERLVRASRAAHRVLELHPGIAYLLVDDRDGGLDRVMRAVKQGRLVTGEPRVYEEHRGLAGTIQQAVLALRRAQLGTGRAGKPSVAFTRLAEEQARALALHRVRTRHAQMAEALSAWLDIVLTRHHDRLNTVRRKLLEGLCLLTLDIDDAAELAYPFHTATKRLIETFSLPALRRAFEETVAELSPLVGHRGTDAGSSLAASARAFLSEHYREDVGLAQVARRLRCSAQHLSRTFKESTGRTLTTYLQSLRVTRAKELLLETDGPLRVIGPAAGFGTAKHFHRVFLQQTGMTPHAFRAAYRT